jgi:hypothetical protein
LPIAVVVSTNSVIETNSIPTERNVSSAPNIRVSTAAQNPDGTIARIYRDVISGATKSRPALERSKRKTTTTSTFRLRASAITTAVRGESGMVTLPLIATDLFRLQ